MWNEAFEFHIDVPKLALVRFVVEDYDVSTKNDFIGQFTTPFTSLRQGKSWHPISNAVAASRADMVGTSLPNYTNLERVK